MSWKLSYHQGPGSMEKGASGVAAGAEKMPVKPAAQMGAFLEKESNTTIRSAAIFSVGWYDGAMIMLHEPCDWQ